MWLMWEIFLLVFFVGKVRGDSNSPQLPVINYPCDNKIFIGYDTSSQISDSSFQKQTNFLQNQLVGTHWTRYSKLTILAYSDRVNASGELRNLSDVKTFIQANKHDSGQFSLCTLISQLSTMDTNQANIVLFVSQFQEHLDATCRINIGILRRNISSITFVVLNSGEVNINLMREFFPESGIIWWNIEYDETPADWERKMYLAYGCRDNEKAYPCNNYVLIAYDNSISLSTSDYLTQVNFIVLNVLNIWTHFDRLALWAYADETVATEFGKLKNMKELKQFVGDNPQQPAAPSLCNTFIELSKRNESQIHATIFVNYFDKDEVNSMCESATKTIDKKLGSLTFLLTNNRVNYNHLFKYFPRCTIYKWNITSDPLPSDWEPVFHKAYGCDTNNIGYPCNNKLFIGYDKSNKLNQTAFTRQQNFILNDIFVDQWTRFQNLSVSEYADNNVISSGFETFDNLNSIRDFVRATKKTGSQPSLCALFTDMLHQNLNNAYILIFVSRFARDVDDQCPDTMNVIDSKINGITVISLGADVNVSRLITHFPNITIAEWDVENEETPSDWEQLTWQSFGCDGRSPLSIPRSSTTRYFTTKTYEKSVSARSPPTTPFVIYPRKSGGTIPNLIIILGIVIPVIIIIICVFLTWYFCDKYNQERKHQQLENELRERYTLKTEDNNYVLKINDPWEMSINNVEVDFENKLGSADSNTYHGRLIGEAAIMRVYVLPVLFRFRNCKVAVKTTATSADQLAKTEFYKEINFMKTLKFHSNVVCMLGYVREGASPLLVLEYCENGDLLQFVRKNKDQFVDPQTNQHTHRFKSLISFACQICSGLEYFTGLGNIHRNVAAQNILLDKNNTCKISGFGLCRTADSFLYTNRNRELPTRWMAIEALKTLEFSVKTDIWAYGVLLYELFSFGEVPYGQMENEKILPFLEGGKRLDKPEHCSTEMYTLMLTCWNAEPEQRPAFSEIRKQLIPFLKIVNIQKITQKVEITAKVFESQEDDV